MTLEAVRHIIATMFSAQNALRELAPEFKWAGMGNVLGDYGEFVCIEKYGLVKAPPGSDGFDATDSQGRTIQIKANHASSSVGFRGTADLLLVVHVSTTGHFEEVYFGEFSKVAESATYSARDNKHVISVSKLRKIGRED